MTLRKPEVTLRKPEVSVPKPSKTVVAIERQGDQLIMSPPVIHGEEDPLRNYGGALPPPIPKLENEPKKEPTRPSLPISQRKTEKPGNSEASADTCDPSATPLTPLEAIKNMPEILGAEQREIFDRHYPNLKNRNRTSSEIKIDQNVGFTDVSQSPVFHMKRSNTATDFLQADSGTQRERRSSACVSGNIFNITLF